MGFKTSMCKNTGYTFSRHPFHSLNWHFFYLGITWTLTCLVKTWTWLGSRSYATYSTILPPWKVMWCVRCFWIHHCGSLWQSSAITPWTWSLWRSTQSNVWWSQMSSSYRQWMKRSSLRWRLKLMKTRVSITRNWYNSFALNRKTQLNEFRLREPVFPLRLNALASLCMGRWGCGRWVGWGGGDCYPLIGPVSIF